MGGGWFLFLMEIGDNGLGGPCLSPVCDGLARGFRRTLTHSDAASFGL